MLKRTPPVNVEHTMWHAEIDEVALSQLWQFCVCVYACMYGFCTPCQHDHITIKASS